MRDEYNKEPNYGFVSFPVLASKGADGQKSIEAHPDKYWEWTQQGTPPILDKAGYLLVTMGQRTATARLTAVASDARYVGQGWMPVVGLDNTQAKAIAVFLNSTLGRIMLMGRAGKTLDFPFYNPAAWSSLPIPDINDERIVLMLADSWEQTRYEIVPQFRDGYTEIRQQWDKAVCTALDWDLDEITHLGKLLADEPRVKGVANGHWKP